MVQKPEVGYTWKTVLKKAWSVRFSALAAFFLVMELVVPFFTSKIPTYTFVTLSVFANIGSIWARTLIQKNMQEVVNGESAK